MLATWCKELTHWKRPWCWERLRAGGRGGKRRWDGSMASLTQWTWVWASSGRGWRTGRALCEGWHHALYLSAAINHWRVFWGEGDCHYCYLAVPHNFWHFLYSLKFLSFLLSFLYPLALNSVFEIFLKCLMISDWKLSGWLRLAGG